MWSWYGKAQICFAYLADVGDVQEQRLRQLANSQCWTEGWTLQELLAPQYVTFYSSSWQSIGLKRYMDITISHITGIDPNVINGTLSLDSISIAQRMSWASGRTTTRTEDIAYRLMGLFGVNMPLLYGEGKSAFLRLQKEIMRDSDDETVFAWRDGSITSNVHSGLLADHPSRFAQSGTIVQYQDTEHREPYAMTNKGLSIALQLCKVSNMLFKAMLHCGDARERVQIGIYLKKVSDTSEQYARVNCSSWAPPVAETEFTTESRLVYIRQSFDQDPAYKPLSSDNRTTRLVQLVPTEDASAVRVRLVEADIDVARYTALSYAW